MKKFLNSKWILIILPLLAFILGFGIMVSLQRYYLFHPAKDDKAYEALKNDTDFEEIIIQRNNKKQVKGWIRKNQLEDPAPLVIFYLGNADNASSVMKSFKDYNYFQYFDNYSLLIVDYPGYGKSESSIKNDADILSFGIEVYDWAAYQTYVDTNNILVMGYSIGTCTTTYVASQRDISGLILIAPYDEALSLYNARLNIFHGPVEKLTQFKLRSKDYAPDVTVPVLIIASKADEVIKYDFSVALSRYFNNVEEFITLDNIKHSNYLSQSSVWTRIQQYLNDRIK